MKKLKPFQRNALDDLKKHSTGALFLRMGLGKTVITTQYIHEMNFKYTLVLCPKIIIDYWKQQLSDVINDDNIVIINSKTYDHLIKYIKDIPNLKNDQAVFISNYEFIVARPKIFEMLNEILDAIILDESTFIKNRKAKRTRALHRIFKQVENRIILTGTPFLNILHIYSQMTFLKTTFWNGTYWHFFYKYTNFKVENYFVGGRNVKVNKVLGPNEETLPELLKKLKTEGHCIFTEDLSGKFKLPKQVNTAIDIEIDKSLKEDYILFANNLIDQVGDVSNSLHAAAQLIKLQQIIAGSHLKKDTNKYKMLINILENEIDLESTSAVIWYRFTDTAKYLKERLSKKYKDVFIINGKVKDKDRVKIIDHLNKHSNSICIIQLQVGRFGLDLKNTSASVFYELDSSLENFTQAKARIRRLSSKDASANFILYYKNCIDELIYLGLEKGLKENELIKFVYKKLREGLK